MTGDERALFGEPEAAFRFEHPDHREGRRHERGLGVLGKRQVGLGSLEDDAREALAERFVDLLEDRPRRGERFGQVTAHADPLRPLTGKDECPHRVAPRNWRARRKNGR